MPDLSPSLTLLLQLPHLDEEVEALVITTGNYLISLSQQLGNQRNPMLTLMLTVTMFNKNQVSMLKVFIVNVFAVQLHHQTYKNRTNKTTKLEKKSCKGI